MRRQLNNAGDPGRLACRLLSGLTAFVLTFSAPLDAGAKPDGSRRFLVALDTDITPAVIDELEEYAIVHNWIESRRLVALTPKQGSRPAIDALPFVARLEPDRRRHATAIGSWDRDLIDAVDVEESGVIGDPDSREVAWTGAGVHVAVIDTGLPRNWRDFLIEERVETGLARSFLGGGALAEQGVGEGAHSPDPKNHWERDTDGHGMAVASHIIGFKTDGQVVDGVAPDARIIPLKALNNAGWTWTSQEIAAIEYVVRLKREGTIGPVVINMSLGGNYVTTFEKRAIEDAIAAGVILVSSAGNEGEFFMGWPAAYPEMISAGAVGWTRQFRSSAGEEPDDGFWWTEDVGFDPDPQGDPLESAEAYVTWFSSRAAGIDLFPGYPQELDVLAPGSYTVAPYGAGPHATPSFLFGTSFASPLTAGVAALMLEKNAALTQAEVESILRMTALPMKPVDLRTGVLFPWGQATVRWDDNCFGTPCDPVGAGLLQADGALAATP